MNPVHYSARMQRMVMRGLGRAERYRRKANRYVVCGAVLAGVVVLGILLQSWVATGWSISALWVCEARQRRLTRKYDRWLMASTRLAGRLAGVYDLLRESRSVVVPVAFDVVHTEAPN